MSCFARAFSLLLVCLLSAVGVGASAHAAQRAALVIGNGAYRSVTPLVNPANDATDMAGSLGRIGYAVTLVKDGDLQAMNDGLRAFLRDADHAESVVVFYSGHGVQVKGRNYLIPVSARISDELDLDTQALSLDKLLELVDGAAPKVKIVILDSCRDNPLTRTLVRGAGTRGLARVDLDASEAKGTLIAFSTAPGSVAQDGAGRNSPFTQALLSHIETPGLDIRQMFGQVRADVDQSTQGAQTPWVNEAIIGSFAMAGTVAIPGAVKKIELEPQPQAEQVQSQPANPTIVQQPQLRPVSQAQPAEETVEPPDSQLQAPRQKQASLAPSFQLQSEPEPPLMASPSFACGGRLNPTEAAICRDSGLATLDRSLSASYGAILTLLPRDVQAKLKANQTAWRAQRDQCGDDTACIRFSYQQRLAFINGLLNQGGAQTAKTTPSFSCKGRLNATERTICQYGDLARLDLALNDIYKARYNALPVYLQSQLAASQTVWRAGRDRCGGQVLCIQAAYQQRLSYLGSGQ